MDNRFRELCSRFGRPLPGRIYRPGYLGLGLYATQESSDDDGEEQVGSTYLQVHKSATVIDTHSDTFSRVLDEGLNFFDGDNGLAVNFPQMVSGELDVQMFALYIAPGMPPGCTVRRAMAMAGAFFNAIAESKGRLVLVQTAKALKHSVAAGKKCGMLSVEGGHIIEGDLNILRSFRNLGV